MNLGQMLENIAAQNPGKTAIVYADRRQSYGELDSNSNRVANALISLGIDKGDRVALLLPNNLEYTALLFGIFKAGAVAVPLDTKYKIDELASIFKDCQPKALISCKPYLEPVASALGGFKYIQYVIDVDENAMENYISYEKICASPTDRPDVEVGAEDTAVISYTSGPTSRPRGAILTHRNLVAEAEISARGFQQTAKDVAVLFALPLHHVFGLVGVLLTAISKGSTVVVVPGLSLLGAMGTIEKERATIFMGVPYIYRLIIDMVRKDGLKHDLSSIRLFGSCGAPMRKKTIRDFRKYLGRNIIDFYGLTEATLHITCPPIDGSGKFGSVGKALPGWEMKIVDDNSVELPANQEGEITVRGVPVMKGYYNDAEATATMLKNGWLYTGDIGRIDRGGYLFITGRKRDMVIRKGQNVYPVDVEELLSRHPKVQEVAVVGIRDRVRGETLRAVIKLKDGMASTEQEIKQFCLKHLASYKVPKQVLFVNGLPRNSAGGICKEDLRSPLSMLKRLIR